MLIPLLFLLKLKALSYLYHFDCRNKMILKLPKKKKFDVKPCWLNIKNCAPLKVVKRNKDLATSCSSRWLKGNTTKRHTNTATLHNNKEIDNIQIEVDKKTMTAQ